MKITYFKSHVDVANPQIYELTIEQLIESLKTPKTYADKGTAGIIVGGIATYRNNDGIKSRTMITLDIDDIPDAINFPSYFKNKFKLTYVMYSTHNHGVKGQRYRVCIPLSEDIEPQYYKEVTRSILDFLGLRPDSQKTDSQSIVFYDKSSLSISHAMSLPTVADDGSNYELHYQITETLDPKPLVKHAKAVMEDERKRIKQGYKKPSKEESEWIHLLRGVGDGQRTHATESLAGLFITKFQRDVAFELLRMWNLQNNPPLSEKKLLHHFNGIYKTHCRNNNIVYEPIT